MYGSLNKQYANELSDYHAPTNGALSIAGLHNV